MLGLILISVFTVVALITSIILKPEISIKNIKIESFWLVSVAGAILLICWRYLTLGEVFAGITRANSINPLKILIIFVSMTFMSVVLDELGFFRWLAYKTIEKANGKQIRIFLYLYIIVSVLTVFTSNDIIILTFTPFICYFTKAMKINPLPYLLSEFVAANTWSMMLIIGNPTNIYLATSQNINFLDYLRMMFLPTVISSLFSFLILFLIFRSRLKMPIGEIEEHSGTLKDKNLVFISLGHLSVCTVLLTISSYLGFEMWSICLGFTVSLLCFLVFYQVMFRHQKPFLALQALKRTPWGLVPFVLSMFIFVLAFSKYGITDVIADLLDRMDPVFGYGLTSFFMANIINNIPMTVFYSEVIQTAAFQSTGTYAAIIGSNLGAILSPIGALAGIMWLRMLKREGITLSFNSFVKYGLMISLPTILIALSILSRI
jgi:arsenical pump membrane protein